MGPQGAQALLPNFAPLAKPRSESLGQPAARSARKLSDDQTRALNMSMPSLKKVSLVAPFPAVQALSIFCHGLFIL
jgi:hypothetical protein